MKSVYALENMKDNANTDIHFNDDTTANACHLYSSCYNFEFVISLVITREIRHTHTHINTRTIRIVKCFTNWSFYLK